MKTNNGVKAIQRASSRLREQTQLATTVEREYPLPIAALDADATLKIQLGMQNFKTVGLSMGRQQVKAMREAAATAVAHAQQRLQALKTQLERDSRAFLAKWSFPPEVMATVAAVEAWTGGKVAVELLNTRASTYESYSTNRDPAEREPVLQPKERTIQGKLCFFLTRPSDHRRCIDELTRDDFAVPLSAELCKVCDDLAEADAALVEAQLDQRAVNAEAARVEERSDDLETTLTIRHLEGSLRDTRDILQVIRDVMLNPVQMAERARKYLPPLPPPSPSPSPAGALPMPREEP